MGNIRFQYFYRDGSNYKKWAEVVFFDAGDLHIKVVTKRLRDAFLPDGLFIAHQVRVPEVFLAAEDQLTFDDHCFHEFASVETTSDPPNDSHGRSIGEFVAEVVREARRNWRPFNPQDRLLQRPK